MPHCSMFTCLFCACLFFFCVPASAQEEPGQWLGDLYSVMLLSNLQWPYGKVLIDEKDAIRDFMPNAANSGVFPAPLECFGAPFDSYWRDGALYTCAQGCPEKDEDGNVFWRLLFAKWEEGEWSFLGHYKRYSHRRELVKAIPCDGGRFIVVSDMSDFVSDGRQDCTPFCLIRIPQGKTEARLEASIGHGQDDLRHYMSDQVFFQLVWFSHVAVTDSHAVLVNPDTGLYWVFSLEKARLVKAGRIFKNVTPEMIAKGGFSQAVLRVNPEKSGTVLVAAQDESLFTRGKEDTWKEIRELWEKVPEESRGFMGVGYDWIFELRDRRKKEEIANKSPLIVWYRIHPDNGRVEKLTVPPEGASSFREEGKNDHWRPMPDGSVRMGDMDNALAERSITDKTVLKRAGGWHRFEVEGVFTEAERTAVVQAKTEEEDSKPDLAGETTPTGEMVNKDKNKGGEKGNGQTS